MEKEDHLKKKIKKLFIFKKTKVEMTKIRDDYKNFTTLLTGNPMTL